MTSQKLSSICSYDRAKRRYSKSGEGKLSPGLHLASAAEAGALVSLHTSTNLSGKDIVGYFRLLSNPALDFICFFVTFTLSVIVVEVFFSFLLVFLSSISFWYL